MGAGGPNHGDSWTEAEWFPEFHLHALKLPGPGLDELEEFFPFVNEKRDEWLFGYYSMLLLPPCVRHVRAVSVTLTERPTRATGASLFATLVQLPALEQLTLQQSEYRKSGWGPLLLRA